MLGIIAIVVLSLLMVVAASAWIGTRRWESGTRNLRAGLEAARVPVRPPTVDFGELERLPAPVQRFFRAALSEGRPMVAQVYVRHRGTFNLSETAEQWKPFRSDQLIIARRPGFDWSGRIAMLPGLAVRVHDAYVAGEGLLHVSVLGLFPIASLRGTTDLAEGELMRFMAEATWYPTVLLPSQGVRWEPVDDHSAHATLTDGTISVTLLVTFNDAGLIETVAAAARGRTVAGAIVPTPWQGRFWNYSERNGMQIPLDGEVAWLPPTGAKPYWRGRIIEIDHVFAQ
jgi:hypothetical protein